MQNVFFNVDKVQIIQKKDMNKASKKVDYLKWSVIVAFLVGTPGAIATLVTFPGILCKVGLNTPACNVPQKDVELLTQTETGEFLSGVTVEVIPNKGAPEVQYTDIHGYVKVNIPSKGDVRVILIKQGYPPQDFNINLGNDQDTIRTIKFSKSGQPSIQPVASLPPSPTLSASPSSSISPSSSPPPNNSGNLIQADGDITWELKKCVRKQADVNCSFVLTTTSERVDYGLRLDNATKMTDHQGHEYFASRGTFVDNKGSKNGTVGHEMQNGSTYSVSIDFTKIPTSVTEVNSLIIAIVWTGHQVKFDDVSIK